MKNPLSCVLLLIGIVVLGGCASIPTEDSPYSRALKEFNPPPEDKAGIYVYRDDGMWGAGLYKDIYIDGICLGETAMGTFFYKEVAGNQKHEVGTESEFSTNAITVFMEGGHNYFFRQYIRPGVFVWGANVEQVPDEKAKSEILKYQLGIPGTCSSTY